MNHLLTELPAGGWRTVDHNQIGLWHIKTSVQRSKEFHSGTGRDFCKIPGSRDFPGRDLPHIFIPGFFGNCSGFFGIFLFDTIGDQFKHFSRAGKPNKHFFHQKNRPANCRREDLQRFAHAL